MALEHRIKKLERAVASEGQPAFLISRELAEKLVVGIEASTQRLGEERSPLVGWLCERFDIPKPTPIHPPQGE